MGRPDSRTEAQIAAFTEEVRAALGDRLLSLVLHGSAAGGDWVARRSDVNTAIVVPRVTLEVLETLAPVVARWRRRGFASPVLVDPEYLARATDTFPIELDDIRRQHRLLAGIDVFTAIRVEPAALRRECEHEARGKLLRLRALFLDAAGRPAAIEHLMVESMKSFLVLLRHLLRLRGVEAAPDYEAALAAGEDFVGPLPTMRHLLGHRSGTAPLAPRALRAEFGAYLGEIERIVAAVDGLDG
jgi:predicted nucleotidyltransferase